MSGGREGASPLRARAGRPNCTALRTPLPRSWFFAVAKCVMIDTRHHSRRNRMAALQPGTPAPEFSLATHTGQTLALSGFRGRRTVVAFLPFAFTGG
jgi:hypothetical protein